MGDLRISVVTGGASGIGLAVTNFLSVAGNEVVVIDCREGDIVADLGNECGRILVAEKILARFPDGIDSVICCAGIGSISDQGAQATATYYFGTTRLLEHLRPALAQGRQPRAVVTGSSMSLHPPDTRLLELMCADDEEKAKAHTNNTMVSYITGKRALGHWIRRQSTRPEWAGAGILLNGIAPGTVRTPLTDPSLDLPEGSAVSQRLTPIALAEYPDPSAIVPLIAFLASPENAYMVGQMVFADGGSDVLLRGVSVP